MPPFSQEWIAKQRQKGPSGYPNWALPNLQPSGKNWDVRNGNWTPEQKQAFVDDLRDARNKGAVNDPMIDSVIARDDRRIAKQAAEQTRGGVSIGGASRSNYGGPSAADLRAYNESQVRAKYNPLISAYARQIAEANAMGMQADRAIGGWGKAAGQEISSAGRRNFGEVQGIQRNLGGMLAGIGAASGNLGTVANNQSFVRGAAGGAGLIAGLGAADQGWFNRARDVNAQTTNFYRNNARDQFAQQAADLLARRNDQLAAMREAQAAGAIKAKTDAYALNQNQTSPQDQADLLTSAVVGAMNAIKGGTSVAEARRIAVDSAADPELQRRIYSRISSSYAGPRGSTGWKNTQRLRQQGKKEEGN